MNDHQLFAFENDFVVTLRCIPMAVRFKLDRCGIKLTLRQWSKFTQADRSGLLFAPCETGLEVDRYRRRLIDLVAERTGDLALALPPQPEPLWENIGGTPQPIRTLAKSSGVEPPSDSEWNSLTELQRFVLIKLSRDNHDNVNFGPALHEFRLGTRETKA